MTGLVGGIASTIAVLLGYVLAGTRGAFLAAIGIFVAAVVVLARSLPLPTFGFDHSNEGEDERPHLRYFPAGVLARMGSALAKAGVGTDRRDPRQQVSALAAIESDVISGLRKSRIYHHSLRPQLLDLATTLVAQRRTTRLGEDTAAVRQAIGDDLWPLLDPAVMWSPDTPVATAEQLRALFDRMEDIA
jgi:hypothetical protein